MARNVLKTFGFPPKRIVIFTLFGLLDLGIEASVSEAISEEVTLFFGGGEIPSIELTLHLCFLYSPNANYYSR